MFHGKPPKNLIRRHKAWPLIKRAAIGVPVGRTFTVAIPVGGSKANKRQVYTYEVKAKGDYRLKEFKTMPVRGPVPEFVPLELRKVSRSGFVKIKLRSDGLMGYTIERKKPQASP